MRNMVRGREQPPDTLATREAEMRPRVREYAYRVHAEILGLYRNLGVVDMEELIARIEETPKAFFTHRANISRVQSLSAILLDILSNPKEYRRPVEKDFKRRETELRKLLGNDFVMGLDEVEQAFMLRDGAKTLEISELERQEAMEQLVDKLAEPDVAAFLRRLEEDPIEAEGWTLVYRTRARVKEQDPLSVMTLQRIFQPGADGNDLHNVDASDTEYDEWVTEPLTCGWAFVTRSLVPGTDKQPVDQMPVLQHKAESLGLVFDAAHARRRTAVEAMYDVIVVYMATSGLVRQQGEDCTASETSTGRSVTVGFRFAPQGTATVMQMHPSHAENFDGAFLSR